MRTKASRPREAKKRVSTQNRPGDEERAGNELSARNVSEQVTYVWHIQGGVEIALTDKGIETHPYSAVATNRMAE